MASIRPTADVVLGSAPLTVNFGVVVNSGSWFSYLWDFGDGNTSTITNPVHVYTTTGYHTVVVTAYDDQGSSETVMMRAWIRVGDLSFTTSYNEDAEPPVTATFTNTSAAPTGYEFYDWDWDFGDASLHSGATGPSHVYGVYGNYNVELGAKIRKI